MDWTIAIDIYCERTSTDFWSEPVNAVTNSAFIVAGLWGLVRVRQGTARDWATIGLSLLVIAIGVGSFLFHTFANRWSAVADVAPITIFIYAYLTFVLVRHLQFGLPAAFAVLAVFFGFNILIDMLLSPLIRGSAAYVPALLALAGFGVILRRRGLRAGYDLLIAALIFLISLVLRTIDLPFCAALPMGTHFLWHLLNAVVLAVLLTSATRAPVHGIRTAHGELQP